MFCVVRQSPAMQPWLSQNLLCRPGWLRTHEAPLASQTLPCPSCFETKPHSSQLEMHLCSPGIPPTYGYSGCFSLLSAEIVSVWLHILLHRLLKLGELSHSRIKMLKQRYRVTQNECWLICSLPFSLPVPARACPCCSHARVHLMAVLPCFASVPHGLPSWRALTFELCVLS